MKRSPSRLLRSLLTESTTLRLPTTVLRQLVGYYGDWRRSRDILNEAGEAMRRGRTPAQHPRPFDNTTSTFLAR